MAVVAFTDNHDDVGALERAGINLHMILTLDNSAYLCGSKTVGINGEKQTIDGLIKFGLILSCQFMFHISDTVV